MIDEHVSHLLLRMECADAAELGRRQSPGLRSRGRRERDAKQAKQADQASIKRAHAINRSKHFFLYTLRSTPAAGRPPSLAPSISLQLRFSLLPPPRSRDVSRGEAGRSRRYWSMALRICGGWCERGEQSIFGTFKSSDEPCQVLLTWYASGEMSGRLSMSTRVATQVSGRPSWSAMATYWWLLGWAGVNCVVGKGSTGVHWIELWRGRGMDCGLIDE